MKAWLYQGVESFRLIDRPIPQAGRGEAVVKISLCGICGTDVEIFFEGILPPGITPGHENVGVITELGEGVEGFAVGDRVVAGPPGSCGSCYYCVHGRPSLCIHGFEQTNGIRRDGGMAEYLLVKDARQMLYSVPDNVPDEDAVLIDTMATAMRGIAQSAFKMGDNVVVSGAGPIGMSAIQLLKLGGARHITALEVVEAKRALAGRLGADLVLDPVAEGEGLAARLAELYGAVGADLAVEAAGVARSLETCLGLTRAAGQVLNLGGSAEPVTIHPQMIGLREVGMVSSFAYTADEARLCLDYLASGRFVTTGMVSDVIPLGDLIEKGFERIRADRALMKVALAP